MTNASTSYNHTSEKTSQWPATQNQTANYFRSLEKHLSSQGEVYSDSPHPGDDITRPNDMMCCKEITPLLKVFIEDVLLEEGTKKVSDFSVTSKMVDDFIKRIILFNDDRLKKQAGRDDSLRINGTATPLIGEEVYPFHLLNLSRLLDMSLLNEVISSEEEVAAC